MKDIAKDFNHAAKLLHTELMECILTKLAEEQHPGPQSFNSQHFLSTVVRDFSSVGLDGFRAHFVRVFQWLSDRGILQSTEEEILCVRGNLNKSVPDLLDSFLLEELLDAVRK